MKKPPTDRKDTRTAQSTTSEAARQTLLNDFREDAARFHDWAPDTTNTHFIYLNRFLDWLHFDDDKDHLRQLDSDAIRMFLFSYAANHGPGSCRWMQRSLRAFLRFCHRHQLLTRDWSEFVPVRRTFKLASVPAVISAGQIGCLLESIDRSTPSGKRDYAIMTSLSTYGVRGVQVRRLRCCDIHWREDRICFPAAKGGRPLSFPLTDEVGTSLLDYMREARPKVSRPEVFLRLERPFTPLDKPSQLSTIIAKRLRQANIDLPKKLPRGSHLFRHSLASRLLAEGQSLKHIADILGHRCLDTTLIYTKVDLGALSCLAAPWPTKNKDQEVQVS